MNISNIPAIMAGCLCALAVPCVAQFAGGDVFNDGVIDTNLWDPPFFAGNGVVTETNGHLHFWSSDHAGTNKYIAGLPWKERAPLDRDWEVQAYVTMPDLQATNLDPSIEIGLVLAPCESSQVWSNRIVFGLVRSGTNAGGFGQGITIDNVRIQEFSSENGADSAAIRFRWDAAAAHLSSEVSLDGGGTWTNLWAPVPNPFGMSSCDGFTVAVYAGMLQTEVELSADLYCDDFSAILGGLPCCPVFPVATNQSVVEFGSGMAFDGTNYLVGFASGTNVEVQRVASDGTLVGSPLTVGTNPASFSPASVFPRMGLVFGQTNYLVAWSDTSITSGVSMFGQLVTPSGAKHGPVFPLLSSSAPYGFQSLSTVTTDGTNFLALWQDETDNSLYGQLIAPDGTLLRSSGFLISSNQQAPNNNNAVAFGATNYLVVWQPAIGGGKPTRGAFVSLSGEVGNEFQISQTDSGTYNPLGIAFDGTDYLVAWSRAVGPGEPPPDLYGRFVSPAGVFPRDEMVLASGLGGQALPALAFDSENYLLSWLDYESMTNSSIRFRFFDPSGAPVGLEFEVFTAHGTNAPLLPWKGLLFDGKQFAVTTTLGTFQRDTNGELTGLASGDVYGAFLPASTTPPELQVAGPREDFAFPLLLRGTPGITYAIEAATSLPASDWTTLVTNSSTSGLFHYTDINATNDSRFYRAMALLPSADPSPDFAGSDDFTSGISAINWPIIQQTNHGVMTVTGVNGHASFHVPDPASTEQNAYIVWHGNPTAADDWMAEITGHNSASYSTNGGSSLQLAVLRTDHILTTNQEGYVVSMAQGSHGHSNALFNATQWLGAGAAISLRRASNSAPSVLFGLRLVYRAASQQIEAWYDPEASGLGWTKLDTISLAEFSPTMTASDTFTIAVLANTYYGPVAEGDIWVDDFRMIEQLPEDATYVLSDWYYPLYEGNEWVYDSHISGGDLRPFVVRVPHTNAPVICYSNCSPLITYTQSLVGINMLQGWYDTNGIMNLDSGWTNWMEVDSNGFGWLGHDRDDGTRLRFGPHLFPSQFSIGQVVSFTNTVYTNGVCAGEGTISLQLVGFSDVQVPGGKFTNCMHLNFANSILGSTLSEEMWWDKDVGPVKWTHVGSGDGETNELRSIFYARPPNSQTTLAIRHEQAQDRVLVDVDTVPTQQYWLTQSEDLTNWTNHTFVDQSTNIDLGHPEPGPHFYRLNPLYGPITWTQLPDMPVARDQFTGGVIDGKLYVFGGNGNPNGTNLNRLDICDLVTGQWSRGTDYDFGIEELSGAVVGGKLYVLGGWAGHPIRITLCYDPETDSWAELAVRPSGASAGTVVAWDQEILALGGTVLGETNRTNVVEAYNTVTNGWRFVTNLPDRSEHFGVGICDDVLYVIGGVDGDSALNKICRFDFKAGSWLPEIDGTLPHPIFVPYSSACPVVNGKLIMAGGLTTRHGGFTGTEEDIVLSNLVTAYDTQQNAFSHNATWLQAVYNHLFLLGKDRLYILGGTIGTYGATTRTETIYSGAFYD